MRKIIVVVCLLSLIVPAVVLIGCGSGGSTSETPQQVVQAFWTAALKGDADTSWNLFSKQMQTGLKNKAAWAQSVTKDPNASIKIGKVSIKGDSATVTVKILSSGKEVMSTDVSLVKENGAWKVYLP
jgi:predicted lipid-binding transport protein (Tim44 family)